MYLDGFYRNKHAATKKAFRNAIQSFDGVLRSQHCEFTMVMVRGVATLGSVDP
jgi:hypothetical protein